MHHNNARRANILLTVMEDGLNPIHSDPPISRQNVSQRHEPELRLPELLPHGGVVPVQIVLPAELVHGRELVYLDHLVQLAEVHHVVVLLCDGQGVPDSPALDVPFKLSDSRLKSTSLLRLFYSARSLDVEFNRILFSE